MSGMDTRAAPRNTVFLAPCLSGRVLPMTLTTSEQRLIRATMRGGTNRDVADRLGVREQTVKNRLSRLYRKLGVRNRLELAMYSVQRLHLDD